MNDKEIIKKLLQELMDNSPKTMADTAIGTQTALCHAHTMSHVNKNVNIANAIVYITRVI